MGHILRNEPPNAQDMLADEDSIGWHRQTDEEAEAENRRHVLMLQAVNLDPMEASLHRDTSPEPSLPSPRRQPLNERIDELLSSPGAEVSPIVVSAAPLSRSSAPLEQPFKSARSLAGPSRAPKCRKRGTAHASGGDDVAGRCRASRQFFVTLGGVQLYDAVRSEFVDSVGFFADIVSYCVAIERSNFVGCSSVHLHAFLEFEERFLLPEVRELILLAVGDYHIDVQAVKSKKSVLNYISKEDRDLYTNVKTSDLNFYYQMVCWARSTPVFKFNDPFVARNRHSWQYLKRAHADFQVDFGRVFVEFRPVISAYGNWSLEVADWWNKRINPSGVTKRLQLYLYGPSNTGKSTWVENCIGRDNLMYCFYPGVGKFFMQDFRPDFHKVIVFEEFEYKFHCLGMLKRLLEGRNCAYPVKGCSDLKFKFKGPVIFVSNEEEVKDEALRNRLKFVYADCSYWDGVETKTGWQGAASEAPAAACVSLCSSDEEGSEAASSASTNEVAGRG